VLFCSNKSKQLLEQGSLIVQKLHFLMGSRWSGGTASSFGQWGVESLYDTLGSISGKFAGLGWQSENLRDNPVENRIITKIKSACIAVLQRLSPRGEMQIAPESKGGFVAEPPAHHENAGLLFLLARRLQTGSGRLNSTCRCRCRSLNALMEED
jgi:hypothetical protein